MNRRLFILRSLLCAVFALCFLAAAGCEDDDEDTGSLRASPAFVRLDADTSTNVVFRAKGGSPPYTWDVDEGGLGSLVSAETTAIYTSEPVAGQNYVTVTDTKTNAFTATVIQD